MKRLLVGHVRPSSRWKERLTIGNRSDWNEVLSFRGRVVDGLTITACITCPPFLPPPATQVFATLGRLSVPEIRLEAEEDMCRYNRLVRYYEALGFRQPKGSRVHYLHNNDQLFRKVCVCVCVCCPAALIAASSPLFVFAFILVLYYVYSFVGCLLTFVCRQPTLMDDVAFVYVFFPLSWFYCFCSRFIFCAIFFVILFPCF